MPCDQAKHIGWERSDTGFFYGDKGWARNPWRDGFKHAPIPEHAKRALVGLETKIHQRQALLRMVADSK
ncbi:MAG: hypothetical protein SXG53_15275 [Pseudomonadota bacterium]|nr:hypothetical protein [Pseudomonadota bacterium]